MQIALDDLIDEPAISITGKGVFTMMLVDPDAPTPRAPRHRSWLLWLVKNIPATDVSRCSTCSTCRPDVVNARALHQKCKMDMEVVGLQERLLAWTALSQGWSS